jgi:predicted metal-dependent hydrolase
MTTRAELPVRRIRFEYPDDLDPCWNPRLPELACAANSISLLMPYAEPYFVKSVRGTLPDLDDDLRARTEDYLRQELQHHVQHRRFNDIVTTRYPRLQRIERMIRWTYGRLERKRSRRFNVAFAAASETIAYGIARWAEQNLARFFDAGDPVASTLYLWHLAEEVEHKTAAFDVFEATDGSRLRYSAAMLTTFTILVFFVTLSTLTMLFSDGRLRRPATWFRLVQWSLSLQFALVPTMIVSCVPGHHPSHFSDPHFLPTWLAQFDEATGTMPLWSRPGGRPSP